MNEKPGKNMYAMQIHISEYYKQPAKEDHSKENLLRKLVIDFYRIKYRDFANSLFVIPEIHTPSAVIVNMWLPQSFNIALNCNLEAPHKLCMKFCLIPENWGVEQLSTSTFVIFCSNNFQLMINLCNIMFPENNIDVSLAFLTYVFA